jgi:ArsR family transcriptional regulator, lead/cadmium/zinc/bismuth-responsive transcriptional repressor
MDIVNRAPRSANAPRRAGKPALRERALMDQSQAVELMRLFKILANDSRLRLLHALERASELCVTDLAAEVEMTPQAVSNQLQRLVDRRILTSRREGNRLFYRIADPCVKGLLDLGFCLLEETSRATSRSPARSREGRL